MNINICHLSRYDLPAGDGEVSTVVVDLYPAPMVCSPYDPRRPRVHVREDVYAGPRWADLRVRPDRVDYLLRPRLYFPVADASVEVDAHESVTELFADAGVPPAVGGFRRRRPTRPGEPTEAKSPLRAS